MHTSIFRWNQRSDMLCSRPAFFSLMPRARTFSLLFFMLPIQARLLTFPSLLLHFSLRFRSIPNPDLCPRSNLSPNQTRTNRSSQSEHSIDTLEWDSQSFLFLLFTRFDWRLQILDPLESFPQESTIHL